ncbi:TonB-dependent outer membrane protein, SusC/RagA (plasmid) [Gemmatirosa kalamazoonensis]|uniref:TonB-dependent outer membrane protein, SusC/RagA n=1 Tax=Gemmatirosa kalamazoonensis TaxID=861299 RepID=W0RW32_9BACT|nr:SusC/RagA family TonB-linked outer membrane protein [Gemmatirosa kalamazoonensis]AHG93773.1 TonB-dependent outer membrane protein, SusC/RagA [Gemmatirosa kalamazoonensis]
MAVVRYLMLAAVGGALWSAAAHAQATGTISGRVVDSTAQQPITNATIAIVGTQRGTLTRNDGGFVMSGIPSGTIRVRAARIGFTAQEQEVTVPSGGTVSVSFALHPVAAVLSEIVTVGYGTQRREAITGSVATVKAEDANVGVVPNAQAMLSARVAGVNVTLNNGEPGAGAQIRIRGGTSLSASNDPLYVVDGVPLQNDQTVATGGANGVGGSLPRSPLNAISPDDIASITVLKDASATAIYGSRGANGVVLIETKRGATGRNSSNMEYDGYVAAAAPSSKLGFLSGNEYRAFVTQQAAAGIVPQSTVAALGNANTNWEDEITRTSLSQNHSLSFSGGSAATQYRASLNYFDQNGVVIDNGLQRYQARLNAQNQSLNGKLQLGANLMASRVNNRYLAFENTGGFTGGVFTNVAVFNPTFPVIDPKTGKYYELGAGSQSVRNPVALAAQVDDRAPENRVLGNVSGSLSLLSSLTAKTTVGVDYAGSVRRTFLPRDNPVGAQTNGLARQEDRDLTNINFQQLLTWTPHFSDAHEIDVVGGYEYTKFDNTGFTAESHDFITNAFSVYNLGAGVQASSPPPGSYREQSLLASFFGRMNYGYHNKYFLTGVLRYDGSSRLAKGNEWALFPAVSASWHLSEEGFMKGNFFSNLNLRAGWGRQGNQAVRPYATELLLRADNGARYPFGSGITTGLVAAQVANPNLKWETAQQTNVGLDYGFRNNRITGTLDLYQKDTKDLLLSVPVPQPAVVTNQIQNVGSIRNRGVEAQIDADLWQSGQRSLSSGLVLTVERNEVVSLGTGTNFILTGVVSGQGQSGKFAQRLIPGKPVGTFWGAEYVGVNAQGQQLFNKYDVTRDAKGNETSRKLAGTTTAPSADDETIIGDANPAFSLGLRSNLTWHKLDASWLWRGEFGRDVFNNTALVYSTKSAISQGRNFMRSALSDPIGVKEPAIYSSKWIEDGSFVRLQNVTLGYSFNLPSMAGSRPARLYVSGDNLLLFTGYSGYDPEVFVRAGDDITGSASRGIDYLVYPRARTFTTGVRIQF